MTGEGEEADQLWAAIADPTRQQLLDLLLASGHATATALARDLPITRHVLPNLRALNFVIEGLLGAGVAYQARFDPQAKGLAEWLRSRHVNLPVEFS